jgi:DNA-directed RNA polymerase
MEITKDTIRLQKALEEEMLSASKNRFLRQAAEAEAEGRADETSYGARLVAAAVLPVAQAIEEAMVEVREGRPGVAHAALAYLRHIDAKAAALVTLRSVVGCAFTSPSLTHVAVTVGSRIEDEIKLRLAESQDAKAVARILEVARKGLSYEHRKRAAFALLSREGLASPWWTAKERLGVGLFLVSLLVDATGLFVFEEKARPLGKRGPAAPAKVIRPTEACMRWIEGAKEAHSLVAPAWWPTIIPPRRWKGATGGGYYSRLPRPLSLVKARQDSLQAAAVRGANLQTVTEAVNAIQDTPFRVNRWVLEQVERGLDRGLPIAGLPGRWTEDQAPTKPADIDTNEVARKAWRKAAAQFHDRRLEHYGRRLQLSGVLSLARRFVHYPRFYLPTQLDFRGRLYYLPVLSPQGPDVVKGLVEFADGKPINDEVAAGWLMVHIANSAGVDKLDFSERIQWVVENHDRVIQAGTDPWADLWWADVDAPWQFLAAARDYAGLVEHGYGYVSHTPVYMDGTCNGLQHLSAMLRDPVGGAAVNLLPAEKPSDIYGEVAKRVVGTLTDMVAQEADPADVAMAEKWLRLGVDRKITKRTVMCLPYGIGKFSSRAYVVEALREKLDGKPSPFARVREDGSETDGLIEAAIWLTTPLWDAIGQVVVASREVQAWLQACAKALTEAGLPPRWVTPDGWPVVQDYRESTSEQVNVRLYGRRFQLRVAGVDEGLDKRACVNGISPNVVHSFDGCALRGYVLVAKENGLRHFALVHDSFGAHAADTRLMQACLRESFVDLYRADVLLDLYDGFCADAPGVALPKPPATLDLDLNRVKDSLFFFA